MLDRLLNFMKALNYILLAGDRGKTPALVILDLPVAFDTSTRVSKAGKLCAAIELF